MRRRFLVLIPSIVVLNALLAWTLQHTDIVAFATVFIGSIALLFVELLLTRPALQKSFDVIRPFGPEPT
jgi:hypothetical protein